MSGARTGAEQVTIEVSLLGPVGASVDGQPVELGGARQRRLLAVLALRAGQRVDTNEIVDAVWPDGDLPDVPRETLRTYVSRLRHALRDSKQVIGRDSGYLLAVDPDLVDAHRFEHLVTTALGTDPTDRRRALQEALALWHGPALAGLEHEDWARADAARLNERRAFAFDELAQLEVELGRHEEVLADLQAAAQAQPLRERTHRLLMDALARSGRHAEALRAYHAYRRRLATDLGLTPGNEIRQLELRIAAEDADDAGDAPTDADGNSRQIRGYQLHECIGEGAFAFVYRATQSAIDRTVAIKQIRAELANRPDFIRRFEAEAQLIARLEHPHIVPLYDFWREPGSAYLVMRWIAGGSLEQTLVNTTLGVDRTLTIVTQIGAALSAAHRNGVIHRDVKPANILLDDIGNAYLSDFGIARQTEIDHQHLTPHSRSIGSPAYAPPEQLRGEPVDETADGYGLAVVAFECLTGHLPFADAPNESELRRRHDENAFPSVRTWCAELPAEIDAVLARAGACRPCDRHRSIDEFVAELRAAAQPTDAPPDASRNDLDAEPIAPIAPANPYKGLRAFDEADAAVFHGRDRLTAALVDRLADETPPSRFIALVGPSGSGKSSVLRAGLVPALRRGAVPGSDSWYVATMVPGSNPFEELCTALLAVAVEAHPALVTVARSGLDGVMRAVHEVLGPDRRLLLVIDQFEELFTQLDDEHERARFLAALGTAVTDDESPVRIVLTLRADFYDRPLRYPAVAALFSSSTVVVPPLAPDELERAITMPAARAGARFEPGLVAELISDVGNQPGALPLLQYALTELFDGRVDNVLQLATYRQMGGLGGAIAARAELMYCAADPAAQLAARRVMKRLVSLGEGSEDLRRRVHRSELARDEATTEIIDAFGRARLLSFDRDPTDRGPTVEIAHEALLRQWPRLREWVSDDRAGLRVHRQLTVAASSWVAGGRDAGELFRGARLATTEEWVVANTDELNADEGAFFEASVAARDVEVSAEQSRLKQQLRQHRRLRRLLIAAVIIAVAALAAGTFAVQQRKRANERAVAAIATARAAETARISADAAQLVSTDRRVALLLAAEAYKRDPGPDTLGTLQRVLSRTGELLGYLGGDRRYSAVTWLAPQRLAAARADAIDIVDVDGTVSRTINVSGTNVLAVDASRTLLAAGSNDTVNVIHLDDATALPLRVARPAPVQALAFGPGGVLAVGDRRGTVAELAIATGDVRRTIDAHPEQTLADLPGVTGVTETIAHVPASAARGVLDIAYDESGARMATGGFGFVRVWDLTTGARQSQALVARPIGTQKLIASGRSLDFATIDGRRVVVAADQTRAWIIDPATGTEIRALDHTDRGSFLFLLGAFVVDVEGSDIVSTLSETVGQVTNINRSIGSAHTVTHELGEITSMSIAPDRHSVAFAGEGGVGLFSLVGDGLIATAVPRTLPSGADVAITADGQAMMLSSSTELHADLVRIDGTAVPVEAVDPYFMYATPLADRVLVAARDAFHVVDAVTGRSVTRLQGWDGTDGGYVAFAGQDEVVLISRRGVLQVHSLRDGAQRLRIDGLPTAPDELFSVTTARDGTHAWFSNHRDYLARIDLTTGSVTRIDAGAINSVSATPDPAKVITSRPDGTLLERDAATMQPTGRRFVAGQSDAGETSVAFIDDHIMATVSNARTQLWDWPTGIPIGDRFPADEQWFSSVNGHWLGGGVNGRPVRWNVDTSAWPEIACRAAGRNLTATEWQQYGPKASPYSTTCSQYPSLAEAKEHR